MYIYGAIKEPRHYDITRADTRGPCDSRTLAGRNLIHISGSYFLVDPARLSLFYGSALLFVAKLLFYHKLHVHSAHFWAYLAMKCKQTGVLQQHTLTVHHRNRCPVSCYRPPCTHLTAARLIYVRTTHAHVWRVTRQVCFPPPFVVLCLRCIVGYKILF
jgi:hypothetical protein